MKPSSDYIDWMIAPEREAFRRRLNEEWGPQVGDQAWSKPDEAVVLVYRYSLGVIDCLITTGNETRFPPLLERYELVWLPDLGQLLGMIEAVDGVDELSSVVTFRSGRPNYCALLWMNGAFAMESREQKRREIAAASLLEKLWGMT